MRHTLYVKVFFALPTPLPLPCFCVSADSAGVANAPTYALSQTKASGLAGPKSWPARPELQLSLRVCREKRILWVAFSRKRHSTTLSGAKVAMKSEAGNGNLTQRAQRHGGRRVGDEFPTGVDTRKVRRKRFVRMKRFWRAPRVRLLIFLEATRKTL
jgi:hypothetical protein